MRPKSRSTSSLRSSQVIGCLLAVILLPIAFLVALVATPFERLFPRRRTTREVAGILRDYLEGTVSDGAWDDFVSTSIADPQLEAIRNRCRGLDREFPAERHTLDWGEAREYVSAQGLAIVRGYLQELVVAVEQADAADEAHD